VTVTLGQLANSMEALGALASLPLRAAAAYRVKRAVTEVQGHIDAFNEARRALLERLGEDSQDQPGMTFIPEANREEYNTELTALMDQEVKLESANIKLSELQKADGSWPDFEARHFMALDWLIEDDIEG